MKKGKKGEKRKKKTRREYRYLGSIASPSSSSHGGDGLDPFHGYAGSPAKPCKIKVYDGVRAHDLPRARGPCVPRAHGGIRSVFMAFYEWGFGTPLQQFPYSLLQYYGLELHILTPSGVLHIGAFMSLFEAYLGIDP
jgi:hypothetical protein